jgi:hypothetical protein
MAHAPHKEFQKCVARYGGDWYLKRFSRWDQFMAMAFAQQILATFLPYRFDEPTRLSLGMVASPQCILPFHLSDRL